jgi:transcriptional regulator with XRE-family HTH domain
VSVISSRLAKELNEKRMRNAYLSAQIRTKLTNQIRTLRSDRGWSQGEFAKVLGKPQSNVSRLENREYGKFNLNTLFELASAFDVGLVVKFVSYDQFLRDTDDLTPSALSVDGFDPDAIMRLCDDAEADNSFVLGNIDQNIYAVDNAVIFSQPSQNALADFTRGHNLVAPAVAETYQPVAAWAQSWKLIIESIRRPATSYHRVLLPSRYNVEITELRQALADSESENKRLRKEYERVRAERDALRVKIAGWGKMREEGTPPAYMIEQFQAP